MIKGEILALTRLRGSDGTLGRGFWVLPHELGMPRTASGPPSRFDGQAHRVFICAKNDEDENCLITT